MTSKTRLIGCGLCLVLLLLALAQTPVRAQKSSQGLETETPTATEPAPTATETVAPSPTATLPAPTATNPVLGTATATGVPVTRPLILAAYSLPKKGATVDQDFTLRLDLTNQGQAEAYNVIVTLQGENLIPRGNGGVQALARIAPGQSSQLSQTMYVSKALAGQSSATLNVSVAYSDVNGATYSTTLVLLINFNGTITTGGSGPALATRTPTPAPRSKLIINSYESDVEKLQAGNLFKLVLKIQNLGNSTARNVTMVLGGANLSENGTPSAGGVSGGEADLSKFAPLGSSNLTFLGEIAPGASLSQEIPLVVNVSTEPGVYTLKVSFVYENSSGEKQLDDQVITLLVYGLPKITASFYQDVPDFTVGEMRTLPLQLTNIGKKATILGDLSVSASSGTLGKSQITIGTIETGGYFTRDLDYTAEAPGLVTLTIHIDYTDDFQQPGEIEKTLTFNVVPAPDLPAEGELPPDETPPAADWLTQIWQAALGFFGLSGS